MSLLLKRWHLSESAGWQQQGVDSFTTLSIWCGDHTCLRKSVSSVRKSHVYWLMSVCVLCAFTHVKMFTSAVQSFHVSRCCWGAWTSSLWCHNIYLPQGRRSCGSRRLSVTFTQITQNSGWIAMKHSRTVAKGPQDSWPLISQRPKGFDHKEPPLL